MGGRREEESRTSESMGGAQDCCDGTIFSMELLAHMVPTTNHVNVADLQLVWLALSLFSLVGALSCEGLAPGYVRSVSL